MKKIIVSAVLAAILLIVPCAADVKAVDYATALKLQEEATANYYSMLESQQNALAAQQATQAAALQNQQNAIAAQQKAAQDALAAQQAAVLDAQNKAMEAMSAQQKAALEAQRSASEAAAQIATASLTTPQVDVVCDTNCAEQNALLYSKTIPDFVLVDISEQRVVFYRNCQRVLGDNCVTGDAKKRYNTTVGIHQILFMDTNRTLHGSYGEAFVKYWMRFTRGGQGLHDAGWRSQFGQSIYISNGSHGCVNLPRETARTIFQNAYVGMYVIVER